MPLSLLVQRDSHVCAIRDDVEPDQANELVGLGVRDSGAEMVHLAVMGRFPGDHVRQVLLYPLERRCHHLLEGVQDGPVGKNLMKPDGVAFAERAQPDGLEHRVGDARNGHPRRVIGGMATIPPKRNSMMRIFCRLVVSRPG